MLEELPDDDIPWLDNEAQGEYTEDYEDGFPYDIGVTDYER
ncbi:MAG TPA: hypothetical protein VMX17_10965 [Candidatus Glassbacteria bacterium]|jgi:hypothetical protein|nr:hypothetical protein [Candidatus Glassbacteria bacterium]